MGRASIPDRAMLFCSILHNPDAPLIQTLQKLIGEFGEMALETEPLEFTYTDYYRHEMGHPLYRVMTAFSELIERDCLPEIKTKTNEIEDLYRQDGKRLINIDPGLLTLENICLATTKPYSHRLYLGKGIWAEITLIYKGSSYQKLAWTYPDYASEDLIRVFNGLRDDYKRRVQCRQV